MPDHFTINLNAVNFGPGETVIAEGDGLAASAFRYASGVAALRIRNRVGEIVALPFQGQQIADATFHGRRLTMRSMFDEPVPASTYLGNSGGFLVHCGATAMGNPAPEDTPSAARRIAEPALSIGLAARWARMSAAPGWA